MQHANDAIIELENIELDDAPNNATQPTPTVEPLTAEQHAAQLRFAIMAELERQNPHPRARPGPPNSRAGTCLMVCFFSLIILLVLFAAIGIPLLHKFCKDCFESDSENTVFAGFY